MNKTDLVLEVNSFSVITEAVNKDDFMPSVEEKKTVEAKIAIIKSSKKNLIVRMYHAQSNLTEKQKEIFLNHVEKNATFLFMEMGFDDQDYQKLKSDL